MIKDRGYLVLGYKLEEKEAQKINLRLMWSLVNFLVEIVFKNNQKLIFFSQNCFVRFLDEDRSDRELKKMHSVDRNHLVCTTI